VNILGTTQMTEVFYQYNKKPLTTHIKRDYLYAEHYAGHYVGYCSIPRNSSKYHRGIFGHNPSKALWNKTSTWYAVIRDPRQRLISGLEECARRKGWQPNCNILMKQLLHFPQQFDEHLETQSWYVSQAPVTPYIVNFNTQKKDLQQLFAHIPQFTQHLNVIKPPEKDISMWSSVLIDRCIEKHYECDMRLWESVCN